MKFFSFGLQLIYSLIFRKDLTFVLLLQLIDELHGVLGIVPILSVLSFLVIGSLAQNLQLILESSNFILALVKLMLSGLKKSI